MKKFLMAGASALALLTAVPANAQHGPSSYFNGHTRLYNPGSLGGPPSTRSLACSFWYNTGNTATAILYDSSNYINVSLMLAITHELGTSNNHIAIMVGDLPQTHFWSMVSQTPILTDDQWHHVSFALTTSLHLAVLSIDGVSALLDNLQGDDTGPFQIPVQGNRWMIGAALGPRPILPPTLFDGQYVGVGVAQYEGALDQLTCHFADTDYIDILRPNRGMGYVRSIIDATTGTRMIFQPMELGEFCSMVFADYSPLCMRGPPEQFKLNNGGSTAFTTIEGGLVDFIDSPWSKWWE